MRCSAMGSSSVANLEAIRFIITLMEGESPLRFITPQTLSPSRRSWLDGRRPETFKTLEEVRILVQGFDGRE
jgi:hypothetical protein